MRPSEAYDVAGPLSLYTTYIYTYSVQQTQLVSRLLPRQLFLVDVYRGALRSGVDHVPCSEITLKQRLGRLNE